MKKNPNAKHGYEVLPHQLTFLGIIFFVSRVCYVAKSEKFITAESNPILGFAFPRKIECDMCPHTKTALNIMDTTLTWPSCLDIDFF